MNPKVEAYLRFLQEKVVAAPMRGFEVSAEDVNPACPPHVRAIVPWMVRRGRAACFSRFGLQKTVTQLEAVRLTREHAGGRALIVCPLGVRQEFRRDAVERLGWREPPRFIRTTAEADDPEGFYLTNYESVREGKIDPLAFSVASLDEAAVLRGFGGSKTFREFMALFAGDDRSGARTPGVPFRYVATATPSPNEFIELPAYAAYLDVMDVSAAKTRFFKRDSTKADHLTLHPHKEKEFWLWVASWAIFLQQSHRAVFVGIGFKFSDFIQACHRQQRYGQQFPVRIDLIYTEAEREVRRTLERKWHQHEVLVEQMAGIIREYGLGDATAAGLARTMGCERAEISGEGYRLVNNDAVLSRYYLDGAAHCAAAARSLATPTMFDLATNPTEEIA